MNSRTTGVLRKLKDADGRFLWSDGLTAGRLNEELGIDTSLAQAALSARTEGDLVSVLDGARVGWQVDALLELATGATVEQVRQSFHLDQVVDVSDEADDLLRAVEFELRRRRFGEVAP